MLNKVMLIGHLGRDPELRYTQTGAPIATLNIATDESYTDRDGNKVERTEWHRVSVFQRQAENCANYLSKGSIVYVEGSARTPPAARRQLQRPPASAAFPPTDAPAAAAGRSRPGLPFRSLHGRSAFLAPVHPDHRSAPTDAGSGATPFFRVALSRYCGNAAFTVSPQT